MFSILNKIDRRIKKIEKHHNEAKRLLNGAKKPVEAQRELIDADKEQLNMLNEFFEYQVRRDNEPFWRNWSKREWIVVAAGVGLIGGPNVMGLFKDVLGILGWI